VPSETHEPVAQSVEASEQRKISTFARSPSGLVARTV
jgi:hypothetical protein